MHAGYGLLAGVLRLVDIFPRGACRVGTRCYAQPQVSGRILQFA